MDDDDGHIMIDNEDDPIQVDQTQGFFSMITSPFSSSIEFFESYGWFILIGTILLYFLYQHFKQRFVNTNRRSQSFRNAKNEDEELERIQRIEEVRRKQQEAYDAAAKRYLEEKKRKEDQEALKKVEEWEKQKQGQSTKSESNKLEQADELSNLGLSSSSKIQKKPRLRGSDYNPLLGSSSGSSGGSCSWRPGKKGPARGG
ncbi:unnamed protein product [Brachionus calyciflorus]|uniref:Selenoprotein S n=1 Tax=Brachionus calyciflorus TaxID=104777 RepID=A0A814A458_9BILA|nr:unnamed protein product [Brachionus calyciflorus]